MLSIAPLHTDQDDAVFPLYFSTVRAGFPSPADDFAESSINLSKYLVSHPSATFLVRVSGHSMRDAAILDGDLLVVDRSLPARDGTIVVAAIDGEFTLKRLRKKNAKLVLCAENEEYPDIELSEESDNLIWGVVRHVIHSY